MSVKLVALLMDAESMAGENARQAAHAVKTLTVGKAFCSGDNEFSLRYLLGDGLEHSAEVELFNSLRIAHPTRLALLTLVPHIEAA